MIILLGYLLLSCAAASKYILSGCTHRRLPANGLNIISCPRDKNKSNSFMGLYVPVGGRLDGPNPGLAHLIEHLIYQPGSFENSFVDTVIYQLGGFANAVTSLNSTIYHFDVSPSKFRDVIPIFAKLFVSPTFSKDSTDREIEIIEQEVRTGSTIASRRANLIQKLMNQSHPISSRFGGSRESLGKPEMFMLARKHWENYYKSSEMTLFIYANDPDNNLHTITDPVFSHIPTHQEYQMPPKPIPQGPLFDPQLYTSIIRIYGQSAELLELRWDIPVNLSDNHCEGAIAKVLNYILNFNGSPAPPEDCATLINSMSVKVDEVDGGHMKVSLTAFLTPEGSRHLSNVIQSIKEWIDDLEYPDALYNPTITNELNQEMVARAIKCPFGSLSQLMLYNHIPLTPTGMSFVAQIITAMSQHPFLRIHSVEHQNFPANAICDAEMKLIYEVIPLSNLNETPLHLLPSPPEPDRSISIKIKNDIGQLGSPYFGMLNLLGQLIVDRVKHFLPDVDATSLLKGEDFCINFTFNYSSMNQWTYTMLGEALNVFGVSGLHPETLMNANSLLNAQIDNIDPNHFILSYSRAISSFGSSNFFYLSDPNYLSTNIQELRTFAIHLFNLASISVSVDGVVEEVNVISFVSRTPFSHRINIAPNQSTHQTFPPNVVFLPKQIIPNPGSTVWYSPKETHAVATYSASVSLILFPYPNEPHLYGLLTDIIGRLMLVMFRSELKMSYTPSVLLWEFGTYSVMNFSFQSTAVKFSNVIAYNIFKFVSITIPQNIINMKMNDLIAFINGYCLRKETPLLQQQCLTDLSGRHEHLHSIFVQLVADGGVLHPNGSRQIVQIFWPVGSAYQRVETLKFLASQNQHVIECISHFPYHY